MALEIPLSLCTKSPAKAITDYEKFLRIPHSEFASCNAFAERVSKKRNTLPDICIRDLINERNEF